MRKFTGRLARDQRGATVIEYALIAALIAMMLVSTFLALGGTVGGYYDNVSEDYRSANQ